MIHLLMKFDEDRPVFTGLAFAKGSMARSVAEHRNREKQGFHYTHEFPVDSSEDYDGSEDLDESVTDVIIVMVDDKKENMIHTVHTDIESAHLAIEAKSALNPNLFYQIRPTKVNHCYPSDMGDAGSVAML